MKEPLSRPSGALRCPGHVPAVTIGAHRARPPAAASGCLWGGWGDPRGCLDLLSDSSLNEREPPERPRGRRTSRLPCTRMLSGTRTPAAEASSPWSGPRSSGTAWRRSAAAKICRESTGMHKEPATEDRKANGQPERVGRSGRLASGGELRRVRRSGRQRVKEECSTELSSPIEELQLISLSGDP